MIASWLIDQLAQQGVVHFCLSPGSRSTPLVIAASKHPKAKMYVHYDERGLGFFALGIAKAVLTPVVVIVTSGTAVGNLFPSVMEAYNSHIPLIFLTADRPHELRNTGANQTCDQVKIFEGFIQWQTDLPEMSDEKSIRSIAAQSYFAARNGPVHINCPFKEPLYKETELIEGKPISFSFPRLRVDSFRTQKSKGVILAGKLPNVRDLYAVLNLSARLEWPLLADILSNARCHPSKEQVRYFDWIEKPNPEFILHFGERMTSKRILSWLKSINAEYIHVSPWPELQDPERILTGRVLADIDEFCKIFEAAKDPNWRMAWEDREPLFRETAGFTEVHAMRKLEKLLPPDFGVFLGNGMPIRDADHFFFPRKCRGFFANRGLSGIDGNIATIAGLAETMPILGFIGDQAALYDLNSLALLKKAKYRAILIISNNFGGGIFHHLEMAASPHFEQFWAMKHDFQFEQAARMFDLPYKLFDELTFEETAVVELITNREQNALYQKSQQKPCSGVLQNLIS